MGLQGLADTDDKIFKVVEFFRSSSKAIKIMRDKGAAIAAGDNGSINIWKDKYNRYRGEAYCYKIIQSGINCGTQKELKVWLDKTLPSISKV